MQSIERFNVENFIVKICQDDSPESPREWSNLGIMACFCTKYTLGDKHSFYDPFELEDFLKQNKGSVVLGLWLYDHSGISMTCFEAGLKAAYPYNSPWDAGQVGYIYATPEMIRAEYKCKRISKDIREKVTKCLQQEVSTYNQYLMGDVYGYQIEDSEGEHIDSCWGFYGMDYCIKEATESAQGYADQEHAKGETMVAYFEEEI